MTQHQRTIVQNDVHIHRDLFGNLWIEVHDGKSKSTAIVPPSLIDRLVTEILTNWAPDQTITIKPMPMVKRG